MTIKPSELRRTLFAVLDRCLETGEVVDVPRKGGVVRMSALRQRIPISKLPQRPDAVVDGDTLDSFSPAEWRP